MIDTLIRGEQTSPAAMQSLIRFVSERGPAQDYWLRFLKALAPVLESDVLLLLRAQPGMPWQAFEQWPAKGDQPLAAEEVVDQVMQFSGPGRSDRSHWILSADGHPRSGAIELCQMPSDGERLLLIARLAESSQQSIELAEARLQLAMAIAREHWEYSEASSPERAQSEGDPSLALYQLIRSGIRISQQRKFLQACFELCGMLASRYQASRVAVGWRDGPVVRLKAVSEMEKFDAKSSLARSSESAMEEALDQQAVIIFPAAATSPFVSKAHAAHAEAAGAAAVVSIPFGRGDALEGVVLLERPTTVALSEGQVWEVRLLLDQVCQTLVDLHDRDRWVGARLWA
ncbi:MAG: hypothetical protein RJA77_530, partial [Pseudomonadota bacterium]